MTEISLGLIDVSDASQFNLQLTRLNSARGYRYNAEITHKALMKHRSIVSSDQDIFKQKVFAQVKNWDEMWKKQLEKQTLYEEKQKIQMDKEAKKALAAEESEEAQALIASINGLLQQALNTNDAINWEALKDRTHFNKPKPQKKEPPPPPSLTTIPLEPKETDSKYIPAFSFLEKLFKSKGQPKLAAVKKQFQIDWDEWKRNRENIILANEQRKKEYDLLLLKMEEEYTEELKKWEEDKLVFKDHQNKSNERIEARREQYLQRETEAIIDYCDMVISNSQYPETFPKEAELEYIPDTKTLIVEYRLPSIGDLPRIKEVKYVQSRDEFNKILISESELNRMYDNAIYHISLRTIHELFEADVIYAIDAIALNGCVKSVDKGTGQDIFPCILSIHTKRDEFLSINLSNIDPKTCFKKLKGVGSSKLYSLTPIAPILQIDKEDRRFIPSYAVADNIKEGDNLAIMDWEDFEHLIREIFEKEFSQNGAEVKITQASRDWGVDAVVFDPDPLRGGKIIIQAKRYANTVTSSAVRDLYGTILNEGAIKGILVTTSDYGPDAYAFAKDKPLTLLNGSNLLHLLAKHGHKARIDLAEAKKILLDEGKK